MNPTLASAGNPTLATAGSRALLAILRSHFPHDARQPGSLRFPMPAPQLGEFVDSSCKIQQANSARNSCRTGCIHFERPTLSAGANTDDRVDMHVAPPDTDPRVHVYLCVSGEKPININYESELLPASYPRLVLAIRREQEHRLLDLCDEAVKFS